MGPTIEFHEGHAIWSIRQSVKEIYRFFGYHHDPTRLERQEPVRRSSLDRFRVQLLRMHRELLCKAPKTWRDIGRTHLLPRLGHRQNREIDRVRRAPNAKTLKDNRRFCQLSYRSASFPIYTTVLS